MVQLTVQLVLHYNGAGFAGWQKQPGQRTVQGVLEDALGRLCSRPVKAVGAGRTDTGVHARGQAAAVLVPDRWQAAPLRRALNAVLPEDLWIAAAFPMRPDFHARFSATSRSYSYYVGTDDAARSPFRRPFEWHVQHPLDISALELLSAQIVGAHSFRAFAVQGTAPREDDHRCTVESAAWSRRAGGLLFEIRANRFLHHMVRFLVGTFIDVASGRRPTHTVAELLGADDNRGVSPPAPAHALFLDRVVYPDELYLRSS